MGDILPFRNPHIRVLGMLAWEMRTSLKLDEWVWLGTVHKGPSDLRTLMSTLIVHQRIEDDQCHFLRHF